MPVLKLTLLSFTVEPGPTVMPPLLPPPRLLLLTLLPRTLQPPMHTIPSEKLLETLLSVTTAGVVRKDTPLPTGEPLIAFFITTWRAGPGSGAGGNGITGGANTGPGGAPGVSETPKPSLPVIWFSWMVLPMNESTPPPPVPRPFMLITLCTITLVSPMIPEPALSVITLFSILQRVAPSPTPGLPLITVSTTRQLKAPVTPALFPAIRSLNSLRSGPPAMPAPPKPVMTPFLTVRPGGPPAIPDAPPAPVIVKPFRSISTFGAPMTSAPSPGPGARFPVST